jgi:branched-chain amino acid transport system substrate-binding protein
MRRMWSRRAAIVVAAVSLLGVVATAAATASTDSRGAPSASTLKVGFIYSRTGALAAFGAEEFEGFQYGLQYLKSQHNTCGGHKLNVTYVDDQTVAANAVNSAKDLIGQGYKIIAGSTSSGAATAVAPIADQNNVLFISGPAAADAVTGLNRHTFRAGRQSYQDVQTAANILPPKTVGKKVVVFAEDTAFGASNFTAVQQVFGGKGHNVSKILVPFQAADLTPYAQQLKNANADLVFVAWAGSNSAAMWQSLDQQKVFDTSDVATGLANRDTYATFGPIVGPKAKLLSHYIYQGPKNKVNTWLVKKMRARAGHPPDIFTPDGFNTALMICHAVQVANGDDVDKMISALEGWQFLGPKGITRIRKADHALIQPMFIVSLVKGSNGKYDSKWLKTVSPGNVQPPVRPFP